MGFLERNTAGDVVHSPTLMSETFRIAIAAAAALGEIPESADISTAFLLALIPGGAEIWVQPPKGWIPKSEIDKQWLETGGMWRLAHALCG